MTSLQSKGLCTTRYFDLTMLGHKACDAEGIIFPARVLKVELDWTVVPPVL